MAQVFLFLTRVFDKKKYAEEFLRGSVRTGPVLGYRKLEGDPRNDPMEGVFDSRLVDGLKVALKGPAGYCYTLKLGDRMTTRPAWVNRFSLLCTTASFYDDDWVVPEKHIDQVLDRYIRVPEATATLGDFAVIFDLIVFVDRLKAAAEAAGLLMKYGPVEYGRRPVPSFGPNDTAILFRKRAQYKREREFRFAFESPHEVRGPITLDVGDLSDIATLCLTREINEGLEVSCDKNNPDESVAGRAASWKDDL